MWAQKLTWLAVDVPKVTELQFSFKQEWNVAMIPFSVPGSARIFWGQPINAWNKKNIENSQYWLTLICHKLNPSTQADSIALQC